jgi:uncharacterized membrane protein YeaQ/YmgE (transglycosylase-associated protein family)
LEETARQVIDYLQTKPAIMIAIALISGVLAMKTVASDRRGNWVFSLVIGLLGCFIANFALFHFGLVPYIEQLPGFRLIFDFMAAYFGSLVIATLIHFIKPL